MFMLDLVSWWYGAGWKGTLSATKRRLQGLADMFSVDILLRTLFSPWKRIITPPRAGLDARLRAFGDNFVSRCIGFTVRFFVLLAAGLSYVGLLLIGLAELLLWPLLPVIGVGLIVWGVL